MAYLVPWNETNQRHNVQLQIVHDDHRETTLLEVGAQIEVGRPPGIPPGSEQRTQFTMSAVLTLAWPGTYVITAQIEGQPPENGGRTVFRVVPGPQLTTHSPS